MNDNQRATLTPKLAVGGILLALGAIFTLDNFGLLDAGSIWEYWPLILIVAGISHVFRPREHGSRTWGYVEIAVGLFFLLRNLGVFWISVWKIWPPVLALAGLHMIWQAMNRRSEAEASGDGSSLVAGSGASGSGPEPKQYLNEFALFGGGARAVRSPNFRGGSAGVIFGGFEIDLRESAMGGDSATVDLFALFGGIVLRVPASWDVNMKATPIMGSAEYKPQKREAVPEGPRKTLTVTGVSIFGGLEVKSA
jgi:predicted membrane protein